MQLPPADWLQSPNYNHFKNLVDSLQVVNDCIERSVKDVTEFINDAKDADCHDRVMVVVNHPGQLVDFYHLTKLQMDNMDR